MPGCRGSYPIPQVLLEPCPRATTTHHQDGGGVDGRSGLENESSGHEGTGTFGGFNFPVVVAALHGDGHELMSTEKGRLGAPLQASQV